MNVHAPQPTIRWTKELALVLTLLSVIVSGTTYIVTRIATNAAQQSRQDTRIEDIERRVTKLEDTVTVNTKIIVKLSTQMDTFIEQHKKMMDNQEEMKRQLSEMSDGVHTLNREFKQVAHPELERQP